MVNLEDSIRHDTFFITYEREDSKMRKNKEKDYSRYNIEEVMCCLSKKKEDAKSNWGKYLMRCSYEDSVARVDIRHMNFKDDGSTVIGKGISLEDSETDTMVDTLVSHGYGTTKCLENEVERRKKMYGITSMEKQDEKE